MTTQRKTLLSVMAVMIVVVIVIVFSYRYFTAKPPASDASQDTTTQSKDTTAPTQTDATIVPATPDATVDAIIKDAALDDATLQTDVKNEKAAVSASGIDINTLSQTYDETKL